MRNRLLKMCIEKNIQESSVLRISEQMQGKTEEQREEIAKKTIKDMERGLFADSESAANQDDD